MPHRWIGIDVAKDNFEAALKYDGTTRSFPNTPAGAKALLKWATTLPNFHGHIAMEATGTYSRQLAIYLHTLGAHPAIINPCHIHKYHGSFGYHNKTDKIDARLITRFANERQPRLWEMPSPNIEALKTLLQQRDQAKIEQDKLNKQIKAMVNPHKLILKRQKDNDTYIKNLETEIRKTEHSDKQFAKNAQLLRTMPGVGQWSALAMLTGTDNFQNFTRASLASYCGLAPCVRHSGNYKGPGHIPHSGPPLIKKYLYMAAQTNTRTNAHNPLADHYRKLRKNNKTGKQALCALMRKMLLTARALIQTQTPYNPQIQTATCG